MSLVSWLVESFTTVVTAALSSVSCAIVNMGPFRWRYTVCHESLKIEHEQEYAIKKYKCM